MLETRELKINDLTHFHANPRHGDVGAISESLKHNGQYRAIVVNKGTYTGRPMEILAGNHTVKAAKALGWETITAHLIDVDNDKAAQIVLADNRTNDLADNDTHTLIELLEGLDDLRGTGYTPEDLDELNDALNGAPGAADYLEPGDDAYTAQYAVQIVCRDENEQQAVYEKLNGEGYNCRVVAV